MVVEKWCDCGWPKIQYCHAEVRNKWVKRCGKVEYEFQLRQPPKRKCVMCSRKIDACMGFALARDYVSGSRPIRELCGRCINLISEDVNPNWKKEWERLEELLKE